MSRKSSATPQQPAEFHLSQAIYHDRSADWHRSRAETDAEASHIAAAQAHRTAAASPLNSDAVLAAMRAGGIADETSLRMIRDRQLSL